MPAVVELKDGNEPVRDGEVVGRFVENVLQATPAGPVVHVETTNPTAVSFLVEAEYRVQYPPPGFGRAFFFGFFTTALGSGQSQRSST